MTKLYEVTVKEVHESTWQVEANSEQDAVARVRDGEGDEFHTEYSYTIEDDDSVSVRKLEN